MTGEYDWLKYVQTVHIIGAGLNQNRPAHRAFYDTHDKGFRMVPVHPRDAGNTILGRPILPHPWASTDPELFVMFLSPDSVIQELRKWLIEGRNIPFIWLQPGAESPKLEEFLSESSIKFSIGKCWVITVNKQNISCENPLPAQPWCLQTTSIDGSQCSTWQHFSAGTDYIRNAPLEWVGDLIDLQVNNEMIPKYIRSLVKEGETLEDASVRLS
tara:strand:- start:472 stop:1113 length:642 start_codon:yes stop_codon:yes gene_type:complete